MSYQDEFKKVILSSPHATLGKKGLTDEFLTHVKQLLKRYKTIKIKVLKSIATKSNITDLANHIAHATDSNVLDVRGKTIIFSVHGMKKKKKD
ncbi:MAG: YhbY family RNA-binding protein [Candidatus Hermodarchaeota archaeon]